MSVVFFLVLFCLCFCLIIWFFAPENASREFSSGQVRCLNKFLGANFCFWQPYCHRVAFPPSRRGKCCPFFSFCVFCVRFGVFCRFFYRSSFPRVAVKKKFSGANFCFWVVLLVLCFLVGFCLFFCLIICLFAPELQHACGHVCLSLSARVGRHPPLFLPLSAFLSLSLYKSMRRDPAD